MVSVHCLIGNRGGIILSPTRELALQTYSVVMEFVKDTPISHLLLTGGTNPAEDLEKYNTGGCNIIVATPGRQNLHASLAISPLRSSGRHVQTCSSAARWRARA